MKQLTNYLGLMILLIFSACNQKLDKASIGDTSAFEMTAPSSSEQESTEIIDRKLIKEGQVEFETENLSLTRKTVFGAVKKYNAYVSSDQENRLPGRKSNTIVIRMPADKFDNLLSDATQGVERFESKEIKVDDVTEEFIDIQARLKTKKELEQRYSELLKDAKNVTEILEIEKQAGEIRAEIESIEGRLKYLQDRISSSTLTMTFYQSVPGETQFGQNFSNGFRNGWNNLILFFVMLINIWPFVLIIIGLIIGFRIYKKRKLKT